MIPRRDLALERSFAPDERLVHRISVWPASGSGPRLVATDGGADGDNETRQASWGVAFEGLETTDGGFVPGLDQSSTAAELWALLQLLLALHAFQVRHPASPLGPLIALIDNLNVQRHADDLFMGGTRLGPQSWALWARVRQLAAGLSLRARWVPSHNKRPDWRPPEAEGDASRWRLLNDAADRVATFELQRRLTLCQAWRLARDAEKNWAQIAILQQHQLLERLRSRHPQRD